MLFGAETNDAFAAASCSALAAGRSTLTWILPAPLAGQVAPPDALHCQPCDGHEAGKSSSIRVPGAALGPKFAITSE
jgi:hypothetical protein